MSSNIDNRVVQMEFDNKQFEQGVRETMTTLEKFKKSLDFDKVSGSASEVGRGFENLSGISERTAIAVEKLSRSFTTLWGSIKRHTLDRLGSEIENYARRIVRALSFEGISSGKTKYEEKMTAMRTIMAATGETAEEVEEVLSELAYYSDMTSYSFSQMTTYLGNFTSAGRGLEESEDAMEGIANACARAGISTSQAGRAMNEFAQAMSVGHMDRRNFMTLQSMNFATREFKNHVLENAEAVGVLRQISDDTYQIISGNGRGKTVSLQNFEEMLHYGFMNTEVMMATLREFADQTTEIGRESYDAAREARSFTDAIEAIKDALNTGWSRTFEQIFGNVDEAADFFTDFCDTIIDDVVAPLNEFKENLFQGWRDAGGRDTMISTLRETWRLLKDIGRMVKDAWGNVFGRIDSNSLVNATNAVHDFVESIRTWLYTRTDDGYYRITRIREVIQGFLSVLKIGKLIIGGFFRFLGAAFRSFLPGDTLDVLAGIGNNITDFANNLEANDTIGRWFENIGNTIAPVVSFIGRAIVDLITFISNGWNAFRQTPFFQAVSAWLQEFISSLPEKWNRFTAWISEKYNQIKNSPIVQAIVAKIQEFFADVPQKWARLKEWIRNTYNDIKNSPFVQGIVNWLKDFIHSVPEKWNQIKAWFSSVWSEGGRTIGGFFRVLGQRIWSGVQTFINGIPAWWDETRPKITALWNRIKAWFEDKFPHVTEFFRNLFGRGTQSITEAVTGISGSGGSGVGAQVAAAEQENLTIIDRIKNFFGGWISTFNQRMNVELGIALAVVLGGIFMIWRIAKNFRNAMKEWRKAKKIEKGAQSKTWQTILSIAVLIGSIVAAFMLMKDIPTNKIFEILEVLGIVFGGLVVFSTILKVLKLEQCMKSIAGAGLAIAGIGVAIKLIFGIIQEVIGMIFNEHNVLDWDAVGRLTAGIAMIGLLMTAMAVAVRIMGRSTSSNDERLSGGVWKSILAMGLTVMMMFSTVKKVMELILTEGGINGTKVGALAIAVGAVSLLMVALGAAIGIISRAVNRDYGSGRVKGVVLPMLMMVLALRIMVGAVETLANMDLAKVLQGTIPIVALLLAFGGAIKLMASAANSMSFGSTLVFLLMGTVLLGVIALFTEAVRSIQDVDWEVIAAFGGSIAGIMLTLTVFAAVAAHLPAVAAAKGIVLIMGAFALGLLAIGTVVGILMALGGAVAPMFASAITTIGNAINTFQETTSDVSASHVREMIGLVAEFLPPFALMATINYMSVRDFSTNTYRLAVAIKSYDRETNRVNWTSVNRSFQFVNRVVSATRSMGRVRNTSNLPNVIAEIGSAIRLYYLSLSGLNMSDVPSNDEIDIVGIGDMLVQLASALPDDSVVDTVLSFTEEGGGLTQIALGIVALGTSLESMSQSIENVSRPNITYALEALGRIQDLAAAMPTDVTIETAFGTLTTHRQTLSDFALDIEALSTAITSLSTCFGDDPEAGRANVTDAISAVENIKDIYEEVLAAGKAGHAITGLGDWLVSIATSNIWDNFVSNVGGIGSQVARLSETLGSIDYEEENLNKMDRLLGSVVTIYQTVLETVGRNSHSFSGLGDLFSSWGQGSAWSNFVDNLDDFATNSVSVINVITGNSDSSWTTDLSDGFETELDRNLGTFVTVIGAVVDLYNRVLKAVGDNKRAFTGLGSMFESWGQNSNWGSFVEQLPIFATNAATVIGIINGDGESAWPDVSSESSNFSSNLDSFVALTGAVVSIYERVLAAVGNNKKAFTGLGSMFESWGQNSNWGNFVENIDDFATNSIALINVVTDPEGTIWIDGLSGIEITSEDFTRRVDQFASVIGAVTDIYEAVLEASNGNSHALTGIGDWLSSLGTANTWSNFVENLSQFASGSASMVRVISDPDGSIWYDGLNGVEVTGSSFNSRLTLFSGVMTAVTSIYNSVLEAANQNGNALTGIGDWLSSLGTANTWSNFVENLGNFVAGSADMVRVIVDPNGTIWYNNLQGVEVSGTTFNSRLSSFRSIMTAVTDIYSAVLNAANGNNNALTGIGDWLSSLGTANTWSNFVENLGDFVAGSADMVRVITDPDGTIWVSHLGFDSDSVPSNLSDRIGLFSSIMTTVTDVYSAVLSAANDNSRALTGLGTWLASLGTSNTWDNFVNNLTEFADGAAGMVSVITGGSWADQLSQAEDDEGNIQALDLDVFSERLELFGTLIGFVTRAYTAVMDANEQASSGGITLESILALPLAPLTAILGAFTNNDPWNSFVSSLPDFAESMNYMMTQLNGVDVSNIDDTKLSVFTTIMESLTELGRVAAEYQEQINGRTIIGSLVALFSDDAFFTVLNRLLVGTDGRESPLLTFLRNIAELQVPVSNIDTLRVLVTAMQAITNILNNAFNYTLLQQDLYAWNRFSGILTDFKDFISEFVTLFNNLEISSYSEGTYASAARLVSNVSELISDMIETAQTVSASDLDRVGEFARVAEAFGDFLGGIGTLLYYSYTGGTAESELGQIAIDVISSIANAIATSDETDSYITAASAIASGLQTAFSGQQSSFVGIGTNIDTGIGRGITRSANVPIRSLRDVIRQLVYNANALLEIRSPSRVFATIGEYTMQGFAIGLEDEVPNTIKSFSDMVISLSDVAEWVAPSLADGILRKEDILLGAMTILGEDMEESIRDQLQIHSISPLFYGIGEWVPVSIGRGSTGSRGIHALSEAGEEIAQILSGVTSHNLTEFLSSGQVSEIFGLIPHLHSTEIQSLLTENETFRTIFSRYLKSHRSELIPEDVLAGISESYQEIREYITAADTSGYSLSNALSGFQDLMGNIGLNLDLSSINIDTSHAESTLDSIYQTLGNALPFATYDSSDHTLTIGGHTLGTNLGIGNLATFLSMFTGGAESDSNFISNMFSALIPGNIDTSLVSEEITGLFQSASLDEWLESLDLDSVTAVTDGTSGSTGGNGNGGNGGNGGRGGGYGNNGAGITPGGLILNPTDGYTIGDIITRIDRLENAITNMQIVLDSGVLVGAIGPNINRRLGEYIVFDGRRN